MKETNGLKNILLNWLYFIDDIWFDFVHGIRTYQQVSIDQLDIPFKTRLNARRYQATRRIIFNKTVKKLANHFCGLEFVDIGCGKGKVLALASLAGFDRVHGIEFSTPLYKKCIKNIESLKTCSPFKRTHFSVSCEDASNYAYRSAPTVYYLYNPFDEYLLKAVINRIVQSWNGRDSLYFIYVNPIRKWVFENNADFKLIHFFAHSNHNNQVCVYKYGEK